jgi:hypothetical protein
MMSEPTSELLTPLILLDSTEPSGLSMTTMLQALTDEEERDAQTGLTPNSMSGLGHWLVEGMDIEITQ